MTRKWRGRFRARCCTAISGSSQSSVNVTACCANRSSKAGLPARDGREARQHRGQALVAPRPKPADGGDGDPGAHGTFRL